MTLLMASHRPTLRKQIRQGKALPQVAPLSLGMSMAAPVGHRIGMYRVPAVERTLLERALRRLLASTGHRFPGDVTRQELLARIAANDLLPELTPNLAGLFARARAGEFDFIYVMGLPIGDAIAPLLSLSLGLLTGSVFNRAPETVANWSCQSHQRTIRAIVLALPITTGTRTKRGFLGTVVSPGSVSSACSIR